MESSDTPTRVRGHAEPSLALLAREPQGPRPTRTSTSKTNSTAPKTKNQSRRKGAEGKDAQSAETTHSAETRGRPKIGAPVAVRLTPPLLLFATALGEGVVAEGIRRAMEFAASPPNGGPSPMNMLHLDAPTMQELRAIGEGSSIKGLDRLMRVAKAMGNDAIKRLSYGNRRTKD